MATSCFREEVGVSSRFFQGLKTLIPSLTEDQAGIRRLAEVVGLDNNASVEALAKNLGAVDYFDPAKAKGTVKKGTVVKVNRNGVDEYYMTRKKTDLRNNHPQVWAINQANGMLVYNPHWARIGVNQTIDPKTGVPRLYAAEMIDGKMHYRPAEPGDTDTVVLNIQAPVAGVVTDMAVIRREGIDAFEVEIGGVKYYRTVSDFQATRPEGYPDKPANADALDDLDETPSPVSAEAVKDQPMTFLQKHGVLGPAAGAILGQAVDGALFEDDEEMGLDMFGLVLGSRAVRGWGKRTLANARTRIQGIPDEIAKDYEVDRARRAGLEPSAVMGELPTDPVERGFAQTTYYGLKAAIRAGQDGLAGLMKTEWTESAFRFLRDYGNSAQVRRLQDGLATISNTVSAIRSRPAAIFGQVTGTGPGSLRQYESVGLADVVRRIQGEDVSQADAIDIGKMAAFRILMAGGAVDVNGRLVYQPMENIQKLYDVPGTKELDEALLRDETFAKYVESYRQAYHEVGSEHNQQLMRRIMSELAPDLQTFTPVERQVLLEYVQSGKSARVFRDQFDIEYRVSPSEEGRASAKARKDAFVKVSSRDRRGRAKNLVFEKIDRWKSTIDRVNNLDMKYLPQIMSRQKLTAYRNRFLSEKGLLDAGKEEQRRAFGDHLIDRLLEVNTDPKSIKAILQFDDGTGQFQRKVFKTKDDARLAVTNAMESSNQLTMEQKERVLADLDNFIVSTTRESKKGEVEQFHVVTPQGYDFNPFGYDNIRGFEDIFEYVMSGTFVPRSNFIDNPRTRLLPVEFVETDVSQVFNRYSYDAGRKIHNMRFDMMDFQELQNNYLTPIQKQLTGKHGSHSQFKSMEQRLRNIYHAANNVIGANGEDIDKLVRNTKRADTIRNLFFTRFGWGFGFYNLYEFMAVGPLVSSFDAMRGSIKYFAADPERYRAFEAMMRDFGIANKAIRGSGFELDDPNLAANSFVDKAASTTAAWSDKVADFGFTKWALKKVFKVDTADLGAVKLAVGSFEDSNIAATTIVAQAALSDAIKLGRVLGQMDESGILREGDTTYTRGSVIAKLRTHGISENELSDFIRETERMTQYLDGISTNAAREIDLTSTHRAAYEYIGRVLRNATDTYHGTNRLMRPEAWLTPLGKTLSMYSTYPFNFAAQYIQRRIMVPIKDYAERYPELRTNMASMWSISRALESNNVKKLRELGLSDAAIADFPIEAMSQIYRVFGSMGISITGFMTLGVVYDLMSYPFNDIAGQEQWIRTRQNFTINPSAPAADHYTLGDLDRDYGAQEFFEMVNYFLGLGARTGAAGRYGDILMNRWMISQQGPLAVTPITSEADKIIRDVVELFDNDLSDVPLEGSKLVGRKVYEFFPVVSAAPFRDARKATTQYLKDEYGFFATDTEGNQIKEGRILDWY